MVIEIFRTPALKRITHLTDRISHKPLKCIMSINTEQSQRTHFIASLPSRGSDRLESGWVRVVIDVLLSVSDAQSEI